MKLGIFARTFEADKLSTLRSKLEDTGFTDIHYNMSCSGLSPLPQSVPETAVQEIRTELLENDIHLIGLSATYNMIHPDPKVVSDGRKSFEVLSSVAIELGIPMLSLCTGTRDPVNKWTWHLQNASKEAWKDLLTQVEMALITAETHDLWLAIEPEHGNIIKDASTALRLIKEVKNNRLKIILDPANLFEVATNEQEVNDLITRAMDQLHEHIEMAHAKDRTLDGRFVPAGKGAVNFGYFVDLLRQNDFDGHLVMHGLEESDVPEATAYLREIVS